MLKLLLKKKAENKYKKYIKKVLKQNPNTLPSFPTLYTHSTARSVKKPAV